MANDKAPAPKPEMMSVHNRGIRSFHLLDGDGKRVELRPGETVELPVTIAEGLIAPKGYRELVDAAKMAPAQAKKVAELQEENARLKQQLAEATSDDAAEKDDKKKDDKKGK